MTKRIGVTSGMSGYMTILYDHDGPIMAGIGRYETPEEAQQEARDWAMSEDVPTDFDLAFNLAVTEKRKSR